MINVYAFSLLIAAPNAAQSQETPHALDIQSALSDDRIMQSSSGYSFGDIALRNIICTPMPLDKRFLEPAKDLFTVMSDTGVAQARCSYEHVTVFSRKRAKGNTLQFKPPPKMFSEREIALIAKNLWHKSEQQFIRMQRTSCLYMGRIPRPGECDDYWIMLRD